MSDAAHSPSTNGHPGDLTLQFDDRCYRLRGLEKNHSPCQLRINLKVTRDGLFHVHLFDLYSATGRRSFIRDAAAELFTGEDLIKRDLGTLLEKLESLQDDMIRRQLAVRTPPPVEITEVERQEALAFLKDPHMLERILADYEHLGLVGEDTNKQICYLACVSRKLPQPLAILIQSSSAAGKTALMDATLRFMPPEHQVCYSAMTAQSLYYLDSHDLKHKILAVAEEQGVAEAAYALKILQSEGRLRIASAGKDSDTGRQRTQEYTIEGPIALLITTTNEEPDAELASRCLVLHINESAAQTAAIQARQRAAYALSEPMNDHNPETITRIHRNAQRLLEPLRVIIPWAKQLTFRHDQTRFRRDHPKYLALIAANTLLHQYQRERVTGIDGQTYVVATREDLKVAHQLASAALGMRLDGLLPQTRELLMLVSDYAQAHTDVRQPPLRFTRRQLREALGWSDFSLRKHLERLVDAEYVLAYRTGRGSERTYELLYQGQGREGKPFLLGLTDPDTLEDEPPPSPLCAPVEPQVSPSRNGDKPRRRKDL